MSRRLRHSHLPQWRLLKEAKGNTTIQKSNMWGVGSVVLAMLFMFLTLYILFPKEASRVSGHDLTITVASDAIAFSKKQNHYLFHISILCVLKVHLYTHTYFKPCLNFLGWQVEAQILEKRPEPKPRRKKAEPTDRFAIFQQRKIDMLKAARRSVLLSM